jgi:hypothetical protein
LGNEPGESADTRFIQHTAGTGKIRAFPATFQSLLSTTIEIFTPIFAFTAFISAADTIFVLTQAAG